MDKSGPIVIVACLSAMNLTYAQGRDLATIGRPTPPAVVGSITALGIDPKNSSILFAGVEGRGLFRSADGGSSWTKVNFGGVYTKGKTIQAIGVNPKNSGIVLVGTSKGGMFKSVDGGLSWRAVNNGAPGFLKAFGVEHFAFNPSNPNKVFVSCLEGLYKSIDGAETWTLVGNTIETGGGLAINPRNPKIIFTAGCFVERSSNEGKSWKFLYKGLPSSGCMESIHISPKQTNRIYALTGYNGLFMSIDNGENWKRLYGFPAESAGPFVISPSNPDIIYASSGMAIFRSVNAGSSWDRICNYLPSSALAIDPADPTKALSGYLCLIKTGDSGVTWVPWNNGLPVFTYCSDWELCHYTPPPNCNNCGSGNVYWDSSVQRCRDRQSGQFVDNCCCGH